MRTTLFLTFLLGWILSGIASAGIHFTLKGALSENHFHTKLENRLDLSISAAVDLSTHFRIGLTHRQTTNTVNYFIGNLSDKVRVLANSLDLTIILYYGRLFVPYVQVGAVKKAYILSGAENVTFYSPIVPNAAIGLGIRLNRNFSLKLAYTASPVAVKHPNLPAKMVLDSYSSVGITYRI